MRKLRKRQTHSTPLSTTPPPNPIMPSGKDSSSSHSNRTSLLRRKRHHILYTLPLILVVVCFLVFTWFVNPQQTLSLGVVDISPLIIFFVLIYLIGFLFMLLVTKHKRHGILFSTFLTVVLLLKYFDYLNWLYLFFLTMIFLLLEVALYKSTPKRTLPGNIR